MQTCAALGQRSKCAPIEKWAKYREDAHRYFKITPKTLRDIILWAVIVPIGIHHLMKDSQVCSIPAAGLASLSVRGEE
eukprot:3396458-Pleurochrysis_carterae.AAC.2